MLSGWKDFDAGDILTAADVQNYLQNQVVLSFENFSDRNVAFQGTSPVIGMICFLRSGGYFERYTGIPTSNGWEPVNILSPLSGGFPLPAGFVPMTTGMGQVATWQQVAASVSPNYIINGAFDNWQRGTSIVTTSDVAVYTTDRFMVYGGTSFNTVSRQVTGDTTNLPDIQFATRVQRNSGNTGTIDLRLIYSQETINSRALSGRTATLSFFARAGANFSGASSILVSAVSTGTGTDQNLITTGFTGQVNHSQNNTLTTTWQRFTQTFTIAATATQYGLRFAYTPVGTAGANDFFEITGVQLEAGSVATPFRRNANSIQGELAACQRYYYRHSQGGAFANAAYFDANIPYGIYTFPVSMRVAPTGSASAGNVLNVFQNNTVTASSTISISNLTPDTARVSTTGVVGAAGRAAWFELTGTGTFIDFSAEL